MTIDHTSDVLDSRDVIARIDELETLRDEWEAYAEESRTLQKTGGDVDALALDAPAQPDPEELEELETLLELQNDCNYGDWEYGVTLIHESYFESYMDGMVADCYQIPDLPGFMSVVLDYDALKADYTVVTFRGNDFYIRS